MLNKKGESSLTFYNNIWNSWATSPVLKCVTQT